MTTYDPEDGHCNSCDTWHDCDVAMRCLNPPKPAENRENQRDSAQIGEGVTHSNFNVDEWIERNVRVGWIAEKLSLPIIEAVRPILHEFAKDLLAQNCAKSSADVAEREPVSFIADRIIAFYKEHYSFPRQGESHMRDCIEQTLIDLWAKAGMKARPGDSR